VPYPIQIEGRIRNYLLAYDELALDPAPAIAAFEAWEETHGYGTEVARRAVRLAQEEIASPFHFFDAIYCLNLDRQPERWQSARDGYRRLAIDQKVRSFSAAEMAER